MAGLAAPLENVRIDPSELMYCRGCSYCKGGWVGVGLRPQGPQGSRLRKKRMWASSKHVGM